MEEAANRANRDVVRRHFYSPLPDVQDLPDALWSDPAETPGVDLRLDAAERLLRDDLAPYVRDFGHEASACLINHPTYGAVDAETLYAMVRHARPLQVVELGSGTSSHIIALALAKNGSFGEVAEHVIFDPYPFTASDLGPVETATVQPLRSEELSIDDFPPLRPGDVLFIDTTHTVKTGGDVCRIFLNLIPQLPAGVLVHVHDVFLPFEYPRHWIVDQRRAWAEQYLLQAFLAFNDAFEVVLPAHALARLRPISVASVVPTFRTGLTEPGAFWFKRGAE